MPRVRTMMLAAAGALALAASAHAAGQRPTVHELVVQLPDGATQRIRYSGDVAPQIIVLPAPGGFDAEPADVAFGPDPFAEFARVSAEMSRQMDGLFQQVEAMTMAPPSDPAGLSEAALRDLPPGFSSYSVTTVASGDHVCTSAVRITSSANGAKPQVVRHSAGHCGAPTGDSALPAADNPLAPDLNAVKVKGHPLPPMKKRGEPV